MLSTYICLPDQPHVPPFAITSLEQSAMEGKFVDLVQGSIDYMLKHATDARWDVVVRALEILNGPY